MQCGYCTPGWLTGTAALLARVPHPDDDRIDAELDGHVCRCCTYPRIRRAVHRAAELMEHPELLEPVPDPAPSRQPGPPLGVSPARPWDLARKASRILHRGDARGTDGRGGARRRRPGCGVPDDAWVHIGADFRDHRVHRQGRGRPGHADGAGAAGGRGARRAAGRGDGGDGRYRRRAVRLWHLRQPVDAARGPAAARRRRRRVPAAEGHGRGHGSGCRQAIYASERDDRGPGRGAERELRRAGGGPAPGRARARGRAGDSGRRVALGGPPACAPLARANVVTGAKLFPADLRVDGMLHGCVLRPPAHGATLRQADTAAAEAMPGVQVIRDGSLIGVTRLTSWQRRGAALAAIKADWIEPAGPGPAELDSYLRAASGGRRRLDGRRSGQQTGDPDAALASAALSARRRGTAPPTSRTCRSSRGSAIARWDGERLTVWTATSTPFRARRELAAELGLERGERARHRAGLRRRLRRQARIRGRAGGGAAGPVGRAAGEGAVEPGGGVHRRLPAALRADRGGKRRGRSRAS